MRFSVTVPAWVHRDGEEAAVEDAGLLRSLHDRVLDTSEWANYCDDNLADAGLTGGVPVGRTTENGTFQVEIRYWAPDLPMPSLEDALVEFTRGQISDGAAENGLDIAPGLRVWLSEKDLSLSRSDDGKVVMAASRVAISARDGDLAGLRVALSQGRDVDGTLRSDRALSLAILYAHRDAAMLLIEHGASTTAVDSQGASALHLCALSSELSDGDAAEIAKALIERGADPGMEDRNAETAASYARQRRKLALLAVLMAASD